MRLTQRGSSLAECMVTLAIMSTALMGMTELSILRLKQIRTSGQLRDSIQQATDAAVIQESLVAASATTQLAVVWRSVEPDQHNLTEPVELPVLQSGW